MPTGYTAAIADGITFQDFAMGCARAFGALIDMRDEPNDAQIPDLIEPSPYYGKQVEASQAEYERLILMTDAEKVLAEQTEREAEINRVLDRRIENYELKKKYLAMLIEVNAWEPPTEDHEGMKTFMQEQIELSMRDIYEIKDPEPTPPMEWYNRKVENAEKNIAYNQRRLVEEQDRAAERTEWVQELKNSLELEPA